MNETVIKALVQQAANEMDKVPANDPAYAELAKLLVKQDNRVLTAFNRKIIELTIRECMEVTKTFTSNQGLDYSAPVALAKHFGVTE